MSRRAQQRFPNEYSRVWAWARKSGLTTLVDRGPALIRRSWRTGAARSLGHRRRSPKPTRGRRVLPCAEAGDMAVRRRALGRDPQALWRSPEAGLLRSDTA
jgi:hypothetical protein